MPFHDPDPTDPNMLVGVVLPSNEEATREMAYVFAEEFARMGFDAQGIANLFRDPFYAGAHQVYRALGAEAVGEIVRECVAVWGRRNTVMTIDQCGMGNAECGMPLEKTGGQSEIRNPKSNRGGV